MILFTLWPLYTCSWSQVLQVLEGKPQGQSERFAEHKNLLCFPGIEPRFLDRSTIRQVAIPTELCRLMP
jgi:hypothetical protein